MIELIIILALVTGLIRLIYECFSRISVTIHRVIAIDTEMVGAGPRGSINMLARVSMVNQFKKVIYDEYVKPTAVVTDYRTPWSGIRERDLIGAKDFQSVRKEVVQILKDSILVGHDLKFDLSALQMSHPAKDIRDTAYYKPFRNLTRSKNAQSILSSRCGPLRPGTNIEELLRWEATIDTRTLTIEEKPSLKFLVKNLLGRDIQVGEHDSVEDARAVMDLYTLVEEQWEAEVKLD